MIRLAGNSDAWLHTYVRHNLTHTHTHHASRVYQRLLLRCEGMVGALMAKGVLNKEQAVQMLKAKRKEVGTLPVYPGL